MTLIASVGVSMHMKEHRVHGFLFARIILQMCPTSIAIILKPETILFSKATRFSVIQGKLDWTSDDQPGRSLWEETTVGVARLHRTSFLFCTEWEAKALPKKFALPTSGEPLLPNPALAHCHWVWLTKWFQKSAAVSFRQTLLSSAAARAQNPPAVRWGKRAARASGSPAGVTRRFLCFLYLFQSNSFWPPRSLGCGTPRSKREGWPDWRKEGWGRNPFLYRGQMVRLPSNRNVFGGQEHGYNYPHHWKCRTFLGKHEVSFYYYFMCQIHMAFQ